MKEYHHPQFRDEHRKQCFLRLQQSDFRNNPQFRDYHWTRCFHELYLKGYEQP